MQVKVETIFPWYQNGFLEASLALKPDINLYYIHIRIQFTITENTVLI
jgi:hypothetical protein